MVKSERRFVEADHKTIRERDRQMRDTIRQTDRTVGRQAEKGKGRAGEKSKQGGAQRQQVRAETLAQPAAEEPSHHMPGRYRRPHQFARLKLG
jgi:hypothetical protein